MNKKSLYVFSIIFVVMSVFMGRILGFYIKVPYWDKILHTFSGFVLYNWGIYTYALLNGDAKNIRLKTIFALSFSFACALLWEVWEFSGDSLFGFNSQNGSLTDTMWDMILGCIGGIFSAFFKKIFFRTKNDCQKT